MLKMRNFARNGVAWEFFEHDIDIHQTVATTPKEEDRSFDILGREFGDFVIAVDRAEAQRPLNVIVVHLEGFVADNLKPVDYTFGAGEGVKVGIGCKFLVGTNVLGCPIKEG